MFLGLFLWSNYIINFTGLHHHEEHISTNIGQEISHEECFVCDFQELIYEIPVPLHFGALEKGREIPAEVQKGWDSPTISSVYYYSLYDRGPPVWG